MKLNGPEVTFDPNSDTIDLKYGDVTHSITLNRADPDVPISMGGMTSMGVYRTGVPASRNLPANVQLMSEMEGLLEQYYYNAHRVTKLVQSLHGLKNFKCKEIIIVRNKLIEHADHGDIYSFGFGTQGPIVKPICRPSRLWRDAGLEPNTQSFVAALSSAFGSTAKQ